MDIEVYKKATEIVSRIEVCKDLLASVERVSFLANSVKQYLSKFADVYREDFIAYVNQKLEEEQEAFDALQCCSCDKEPEDKEEDGGTTERD